MKVEKGVRVGGGRDWFPGVNAEDVGDFRRGLQTLGKEPLWHSDQESAQLLNWQVTEINPCL